MSILVSHNVRVIGSGVHVVVMGHGYGANQSVWKHVVPYFIDNFRVVLYDLMGSGTTNPDDFDPKRYSTLHGYADDLLAILDALKIQSCIYIGHSVSAMLGCLASLERPNAFSKLILLGGSPRYMNDPRYLGGFEREDLIPLFEAMQSNYKSWVSGFASLAVSATLESPAVRDFSQTLSSIRPDIAFAMAKTIFNSDCRSALPRVTVPCHIIQSQNDFVVPVVVAHYMQRSLGGETYVEILPTEGHLPQLTAPELLISCLQRHIYPPNRIEA